MAKITGGELIVRMLKASGVEAVFGLHGAHIDTLFQAALDLQLPIIDTRHEAAAGHAAEGYARAGRRLGVALVTAGGGFTNVLTPIANAYLDRTPLLVLAGSGMLAQDETNTLQAGIDQVAVARPITKWAHRVQAVDQLPRLIAQAIRIATAAPRGPVLLDLPWDVTMAEIEKDLAPLWDVAAIGGGAAGAADLAAILDLLATAERPVIILGSEASRTDGRAAVASLVAATGVPVFAEYEALNLLAGVPDQVHGGLIQGLYGMRGGTPDAILMLGVRFGLGTAHGSGMLIPHAARVIQLDPDARELGRLQPIERGIAADVPASLAALADAAAGRDWPDRGAWQQTVRAWIDRRLAMVSANISDEGPMHPLRASQVVAKHIDGTVTVVADGALSYLWLTEALPPARPGGFLTHGYLGSMGVGFGLALGAQVVGRAEGKRTILVTGDGSVGYSIAEFDSAVRHRLPLIVIVMNNRSWGATAHYQKLAVGPNRITNTMLENGNYHDVARGFGADGYLVDSPEAFDDALTQALAGDRPACINVLVDLWPIPPEELILIGMDPFADPADQPGP